jgi:acyl-coenzyme A synthetase/AMP-(fatty) acid ligase
MFEDRMMNKSKIEGIFAFDMMAKAEANPDFPVIVFENYPNPNKILTYSDLVLNGNKVAQALRKAGIGRGDAFSYVMRNNPAFVYCLYAASILGAVMVPIDPRFKGDKLSYQIGNSGSKGVIFAGEFTNTMGEVLSILPDVKPVGCDYSDGLSDSASSEFPDLKDILESPEVSMSDPENHSLKDPILTMYTSGTTGDPKGVCMRAEWLQLGAFLAENAFNYTSEDKPYTGLSLTHGNALHVTLLAALYLSIPAVISRKFTKSRLWDICREHNCTTFSLLGGMMMGIYSESPKDNDGDNPVQKVLSAGTPKNIWRTFESRFNVTIHEWYGAVEGGFAHNPPNTGPIGSFGKPLENVAEMRIVREDDTECEAGEMGELISRKLNEPTRVEYFNNPEAAGKKTRGGWLRSGDICHRDKDGWLYFDYRDGGGLRRQGDFIMPEHLEAVIAEHQDIKDVCVFGIKAASGAPGESDIVAAIAPEDNITPDIKSIFNRCLESLERNSVPSYLMVVPEIPKTASEKNLDRLLRDDFDKTADNVYRFGDL